MQTKAFVRGFFEWWCITSYTQSTLFGCLCGGSVGSGSILFMHFSNHTFSTWLEIYLKYNTSGTHFYNGHYYFHVSGHEYHYVRATIPRATIRDLLHTSEVHLDMDIFAQYTHIWDASGRQSHHAQNISRVCEAGQASDETFLECCR